MKHHALHDHDLLVQAIYDAADGERGFHDVLECISHQLGAQAGHALLLPQGAKLAENHCFGQEESAFATYDRDWRDKDPRFAAAMARPNEVLSDVMVVAPAAFERSAIYNEFLAREGVRYSLFANFSAGPDLVVAPALLRRKHAGPFGPEEIARFGAFTKHLVRAARLRHLVRSLRDDVADLRRALDAVVTAVAILDRSGKVLCANASAEAIVARRDGLRTDKGALTASIAAEARALSAAIAKAAETAEATTWRPPPAHLAPCVTVSRSDGVPLAITLFPLRPENLVRDNARDARVLAILHDPSRVVRIDAGLAAKLHGLTSTEAALASALAEGRTLAEFADDRGCSEQTARTHLKRVLEKTRTTRQPDLVRVLLTGAALHRLR